MEAASAAVAPVTVEAMLRPKLSPDHVAPRFQ